MSVVSITTIEQIKECFDAYLELRPHLTNADNFAYQILEQFKEGYKIVAIIQDDLIVACVGYRYVTNTWLGRTIYIDDLITRASCRGKGYGSMLLNYVKDEAKSNSIKNVHLDTGYTRHSAHKVYLNHGYIMTAHHMLLSVD